MVAVLSAEACAHPFGDSKSSAYRFLRQRTNCACGRAAATSECSTATMEYRQLYVTLLGHLCQLFL